MIGKNKSIERKELLHTVTKLHTLFTTFKPLNSLDLDLSIKIVRAIDRWHSCEGLHGLKRAKTMSNAFVRHLMGTPLENVPLSNRYKRYTDKALLSCNCTVSKVYWVSVFSSFRLFYTVPDYDISTITSGFKGKLTGLCKLKYYKAWSQVNKSFRRDVLPLQNWVSSFR